MGENRQRLAGWTGTKAMLLRKEERKLICFSTRKDKVGEKGEIRGI